MTDIGKVSAWVKKAVAEIAAFDGKLRRIDSDAEKKALSNLLAGNLSEDDKEYIEGFMLDRSAKAEKIDGKQPEKNEERSVNLPYNAPYSANNQEEAELYKKMFANVKLFFDDDGNVVKTETRGEDGELTTLQNIKYLNENERELNIEQKMPNGMVSYTKGISYGTKENGGFRVIDFVQKKDDKMFYEEHRTEDGQIRRIYRQNQRDLVLLPGFGNSVVPPLSAEEMPEFLSKIAVIEEICEGGVATGRYLDADGNELYSAQGVYTMSEGGYAIIQYPKSNPE